MKSSPGCSFEGSTKGLTHNPIEKVLVWHAGLIMVQLIFEIVGSIIDVESRQSNLVEVMSFSYFLGEGECGPFASSWFVISLSGLWNRPRVSLVGLDLRKTITVVFWVSIIVVRVCSRRWRCPESVYRYNGCPARTLTRTFSRLRPSTSSDMFSRRRNGSWDNGRHPWHGELSAPYQMVWPIDVCHVLKRFSRGFDNPNLRAHQRVW